MKHLVFLFATQNIELDILERFYTNVPVLNAFLLEFDRLPLLPLYFRNILYDLALSDIIIIFYKCLFLVFIKPFAYRNREI